MEKEEKNKVMREMYLNGSSMEEIAEVTGYHPKSVYNVMATNGIIQTKSQWEQKIEAVTYERNDQENR